MPTTLFSEVFRQRRVLITGHTGFKGSWLSEWLTALGAEVTGYALAPPTSPNLFDELQLAERMEHVVGDVRDADGLSSIVQAAQPEIVFHLAAQALVRRSYRDPVETFETNVMGTVNLLEALRKCESVRAIVVVTSDKCYENQETGRAYRETDPMGGYDPYSASKGCAEIITGSYRRSFFSDSEQAAVASARAGNVIGGGDWAADRLVPDCLRALRSGMPIEVRSPDAVRPWQHVLEPLSGYLLLGARLYSHGRAFEGPWNFGPAEDAIPVRTFVDDVVRAWGTGSWAASVGTGDDSHEAQLLALDITKAAEGLGWRPTYTIEQAIGATIHWYRAREEGANARQLTDRDIADYVQGAHRVGAIWAGDREVVEDSARADA